MLRREVAIVPTPIGRHGGLIGPIPHASARPLGRDLTSLPDMRGQPIVDRTRQGIAVLVVGILMFSVLDVLNKLLGQRMPVSQIIWMRFLGFVPIALLLAWRPGRGLAWRSGRPGLQLVRSLTLVVEMGLFVWAFKTLPLADVQAVAASTPLLVVALSVPFLGESVGWRRWAAVGLGFIGVLLIVRPGFQTMGTGTLVALGGAVLWAIYQIQLRVVGGVDSATTSGLWSATVGAIVMSLVAPFDWTPPDTTGWVLLTAAALVGALGHTIYSRAFVLAPASVLQPFNYLLLVFATLFGWLVFDQLPDAWTVAGAVLIVAGGLYALHRERARNAVSAA
jgi:drug/metabolite transporter (DMT)-like permease